MKLQFSSRSLLITGLGIPLFVCGLWVFALSREPAIFIRLSGLLPLLLLLLAASLAVYVSWTLLRSSDWSRRLLSILIIGAMMASVLWLQRFSDLGVFLMGGASYWVERASTAPDPEAKVRLKIVLDSTQYGADQAERAVLALPTFSERQRLFLLLADLAPSEQWERRYRERVHSEE